LLVAAACTVEPGVGRPADDASVDGGVASQDARIRLDSGLLVDATQVDATAVDAGASATDSGRHADGGPRADGGLRADSGLAPDAGFVADAGRSDAGRPAATDPSCIVDGCLRSVTAVADYDRNTVLSFLEAGLSIDHGYSVFAIRFFTDGAESTATVTLPFGPNAAPPARGWHVVGNNHASVGLADGCALTGSAAGIGLAGLFGARGAIGVAVDYPGLGTPGDHPYLVTRSQATSALDGLRAATQLARQRGLPISGRYAMVGLSQGGHATIGAASMHAQYAPELDVRAFGATAPATLWPRPFQQGINVSGPHHVFYAMLLYAWSRHYMWPGPELWSATFAAQADLIMSSACLFAPVGVPTLFNLVPQTPAALYHPDLITAFASGVFTGYPHIAQGFDTNRVRPYVQTAPLRIYQGDADTTVLEPDTREVVDALRGGGVMVDYVVVPGGSHTDVAFGYLAYRERRTDESIAWVRGLLDAP